MLFNLFISKSNVTKHTVLEVAERDIIVKICINEYKTKSYTNKYFIFLDGVSIAIHF